MELETPDANHQARARTPREGPSSILRISARPWCGLWRQSVITLSFFLLSTGLGFPI